MPDENPQRQSNHAVNNGQDKNITVLISGSGSNLQALIDASSTENLPHATITHVISDRKDVYGLKRAQNAGIATTYHGILPYKRKYPDDSGEGKFEEARRAYDADLAALVQRGPSQEDDNASKVVSASSNPDIVVCAGFMRIVTPSFLDPLRRAEIPVINLHPSLHGDLVGAHCIERAWEEFVAGKRSTTGVMVHYVIAEVDKGEPIVQREVDIRGCKTIEELRARIQETEHGLIVEGAKKVLSG